MEGSNTKTQAPKIATCSECEHYRVLLIASMALGGWCSFNNEALYDESLDDLDSIPDWCPLIKERE